MSLYGTTKVPLSLKGDHGKGVRTQFGALCYRTVRGKTQVLLITSRTSRRWIIPKGWPIKRMAPSETAAVEAWEEAGVRGKVQDICVGLYSYTKYGEGGDSDVPCVVTVFPMRVKSLSKDYPEHKERKRKWFSPKEAARKVAEPELRRILKEFDPRQLS
ncbi:NUDIX hydrolase [Tropicimonas marinistellae]|uniref:NUDIX hydrolase n=1 Tax=Tropicimonas marinistellae TaxID=1739787 RepID=UPI000833B5C2|nr:NUDIX hydrolase [Tropicimonas marinistellae]